MRKLIVAAITAGACAVVAAPALAVNSTPGQKLTNPTTLDACAYFVGTSTANKTTVNGDFYTDKGTWTGVDNNYNNGPVASLGTVTGSYTNSYNLDPTTGYISGGSETFRSDAGSITQSYAFDATGWHVTVTATGSLSFLASSTDGACYTGPYPRP